MSRISFSRPSLLVVPALTLALAVAACGGDDEPDGPAERATAAGTTVEAPAETAPEGGAESRAEASREDGDSDVVGVATTDPQACPDVVIVPNSGNGLFDVEADGITCEDAQAALEAWGLSGYPGDGPPGFACAEADDGRLRCEQEASGAVMEFETGI